MAKRSGGTRGWRVATMFGAPVIISPSTLLMIALLAFVWAYDAENGVTGEAAVRGVIFAVLLFASVLVHELAHAFSARAFKRKVEEIALTLFGGHTTFDGRNMTPFVSGVTAAAGPLTNVVIGAAALAIQGFGVSATISVYVEWIGIANVVLAIFNILPGLPMDGGRVAEAIVWAATKKRTTGTIVAAWIGRVLAVAIPAYVLVSAFSGGRTPGIFQLLWAFLVFGLLWPAASAALERATFEDRVEGATAATVMEPAIGVPYEATLAAAIAEAYRAEARHVVIMSVDGHASGHFSIDAALRVPADKRETTPVQAVSLPLPRGAEATVDLTGGEVLERVREWWGKTEALAVLDESEPVGLLKLADVVLRLRGK